MANEYPCLQAAMQMQRHKLGLPLEATRGEQISTGFPKSCNAQVTPEAELRSALVSLLRKTASGTSCAH